VSAVFALSADCTDPLFPLSSFLFPPDLPTSGSTANYAAAVIAFVALLAAGSWIFEGRKHYNGPRDLDHALARARLARE
jgi:choline transport protein